METESQPILSGMLWADLFIHWSHYLVWKQLQLTSHPLGEATLGNVGMVDVPEPSWGARLSAARPFHLSDSATQQADLKTLENDWKETFTDATFPPVTFLWLGLCASPLQKKERGPENPCPLPEDPGLCLGSQLLECLG